MKTRKWNNEWVRLVCCNCKTCTGRRKKNGEGEGKIISHGICPKCVKALYPELLNQKENNYEK